MRALVALLCFVPIDAYAETVVQQHIEVDTTGDALVITFDATLDIPSATDRIVMFRPFAPVESATLDGQPITWSPSPLAPDVLDAGSVATPVGPGEVTLRVRIVGAPSCPGQCWHDATKTILTPSWVGAAWYYVDVFDASPFTGTIAVRARSNAHVSSGQGAPSRSEDLQDGTQRVTFAVELPTTLLSVYVGTQERVVADGPFPVTAHRTEEAPQDVVAQAVDRASHGVLALESFLGPYPTDAAHLVVAPRDAAFGGMGMMGTVFISEIIFSAFAFILDAGVIHELAHAYWGHVANGGVDESAPFFSEALAEYSAWRAIGILEGDTRRRDGVRMNSVWYMYARPDGVDAPIVGANTGRSPAYVHATYHKGSSVLRMLEHAVGAEAFDGVLLSLIHI